MLLWLGIFKEKKEVATPDCAGEHCDLVVVHEKRCQQESLKQWERERRGKGRHPPPTSSLELAHKEARSPMRR